MSSLAQKPHRWEYSWQKWTTLACTFFYIQVDPSQAHSHTIISDMGYQQRTQKCRVRGATFRRNAADKPGNTFRPPMAEEQPGIVKQVPKQNP